MALQIFLHISLHSAHSLAIFIGGLRFLKNRRRGGSRYLCKNGGRVFYIGGLSIEGG